jgi:hypothetical protein
MNKKFLYIGTVAIVIILAGINVKLNYLIDPVDLLLGNIEALSDECSACSYTIKNRACYTTDDICANEDSSTSYQICPASGVWCPNENKRGERKLNVTSSVCNYKSYSNSN